MILYHIPSHLVSALPTHRGATVLIPLILCPAMGANGDQTAEVISSIFFVSGISTLVQTSIGDRYVVVVVVGILVGP